MMSLDQIIIALDNRPPWYRRVVLRVLKRWLERRIPRYL